MSNVMVIPARRQVGNNIKKAEKPKLRVAAYCRVSTDSDEQATSYEAQIEHYTEYISKNPEWVLAGIFADDGISGTNTKKRDEFNRMIDECHAGNIDMIITKSISRFARNTLDCLKFIQDLQGFIKSQPTTITEFDETLVKRLITKITVFEDHFTIDFKSGITIEIAALNKAPLLPTMTVWEP